MDQRETTISKIHSQLDELNRTLDDLEKTIKDKSAQASSAYDKEMINLHEKLNEMRAKLEEMKTASTDHWDNMMEHIEVLQHAFIASYNFFKEELKKNDLPNGKSI
ncbi:hypothetical protein H8K32_14815 [Undibacterium jejuense]|uniref:Uncharacterized protein n=1 Tax=Undibacterium jejuense TaxID=1344949 RepID=A0A923HM10_9BURK|nr:hypothetical protein [Undibacterium jejuense]MBC3863374.1 hypothetical protein [Undibacterium jejuense]